MFTGSVQSHVAAQQSTAELKCTDPHRPTRKPHVNVAAFRQMNNERNTWSTVCSCKRKQRGAEMGKQQYLLTQPLLRRENFPQCSCQLWSVTNKWRWHTKEHRTPTLCSMQLSWGRLAAPTQQQEEESISFWFVLEPCCAFVGCFAWVMGELAQFIRFSFTKLFMITFCLPIFCPPIFHFNPQVLNSYGSFTLSRQISTSCK